MTPPDPQAAKCCGTCALWEPNVHDEKWRSQQCWADIAIDLPASFVHRNMQPHEGSDCPIWQAIPPAPTPTSEEDQVPW